MSNRFTHENGKVSGTKSLLSLIVIAIIARALLSGLSIGTVTIAEIPQTLNVLATAIWPLAAAYCGRRWTDATATKAPTGQRDAAEDETRL